MSGGKPKIIYISPCVPPVAVAESFAVLKKLRAISGRLDLTVLAADDPGGYFLMPSDPELETYLPPDLRVVRVPVPGRSVWNRGLDAFGQLVATHSAIANAYMFRWARRALNLAARAGWFRNYDGMITNSSPVISHYVGLVVRRHNGGIRWVQHYSDPFPDSTYRRYSPLSRAIDRSFAERIARQADLITVTTEETRQAMFAQYDAATQTSLRETCEVVPHTYDTELFRRAVVRHPLSGTYEDDDGQTIHVAYLGHFYGARSLAPVYRYLQYLRNHGESIDGRKLRLHIYGTVRSGDAALIRSVYASWVQLHQPVAYLESLAIMKRSDALLVVDAKSDGPSVYFPSKLADYLGAGRPIVAFTPSRGATARIVRETGHLAVDVEPSDEELAMVSDLLRRAVEHGAETVPSPAYANDERHYLGILSQFSRTS